MELVFDNMSWYAFSFRLYLALLIILIGDALLKKLKDAILYARKQTEILQAFSALFPQATINEWTQGILEWQRDPQSFPDPFSEPITGAFRICVCVQIY